jgi:predicted restriction endonuclease
LNGYCLVDKTYIIKEKRDSELLTESVWLSIKQEYNYKCACCGCSEGDEMTRANGICKLEKGHMDPDLPLTSDNTIPQCPYCNGSSKDKRKFNKKGDTIAIKEKNTGNWIYC